MSLINQHYEGVDDDFNKHLIRIETKYQCLICHYQSKDKYDIRKHLMQSCLKDKYAINGDLLNLIDSTQDHINQSELNALDDLFKKHIGQLEQKYLTLS